MAVIKTHPIKSTPKAVIDYICNSKKTGGKLLVSSYGCAAACREKAMKSSGASISPLEYQIRNGSPI